MRTHRKRRKENPFRISFFAITLICCIALSIVFFSISYTNNKEAQKRYAQEKLTLILNDFEKQLEMIEDISLRIVSNYEFYPYYFEKNMARKLSMLETLGQYKYYTPLTDEYFLYYGDDRIYRFSGSTLNFELFLQMKSKSEEERNLFRKTVEEVSEGLTEIKGEEKVFAIFDEIYVLIPLKMNGGGQQNTAVLGFAVAKDSLKERFDIVSGGIKGRIALYGEDGILYANEEKPCLPEQKNVLTAVSMDGRYHFCFQPQKESNMLSSLFLLQILLILMDIFLLIAVANIFAKRAYRPLQIMTEKYREKTSKKKGQHGNALDELNYMMDSMLQSNLEANLQIQKNQEILRNQILQMIMNGSASPEMLSYLDKAGISLPGPFYCVLSISFEEEDVTKSFLNGLQKELEQIPDANEKEYIYTICSEERKLINVICSIRTEEGKQEMIETICDVAESFSYQALIGMGNTYQGLNNVAASWLESMDEVQSRKRGFEQEGNTFVYHMEELRRVTAALENGNEAEALERLERFVAKLNQGPMSMLMLQYILADFLGEVRKICERYRQEVSKQNASMLISARKVQDFEQAAKKIIHEFCENYGQIKSQMKEAKSEQICEYIQEHFTEYDISIENVAEHLHTSTEAVRQAVLAHTGKLYRDYLIYLRIEYAKVLLGQENISVAELCQKVGYGNVSYFIKLFREITGVTPAKYRKNNLV